MNIMETTTKSSNSKLCNIINEIDAIYVDSVNKNTYYDKLDNYTRINNLTNEAKQLIENLKNEISNFNFNVLAEDNLPLDKINGYIDLLNVPNLKFNEIIDIVNELRKINLHIPTVGVVIEHIEQETMQEN